MTLRVGRVASEGRTAVRLGKCADARHLFHCREARTTRYKIKRVSNERPSGTRSVFYPFPRAFAKQGTTVVEALSSSSEGVVRGVAEAVEDVEIVLRGLVLRHEEDGDLVFEVEREVGFQPAAPAERADGVGGGDEARAAGLERGALAVGVQSEAPVGVVEAPARVAAFLLWRRTEKQIRPQQSAKNAIPLPSRTGR